LAQPDIDYSQAGPLIFGDYRESTELPFRGGIDEVKLYDRPLSEQEILESFAANMLVSWWRAEGDASDAVGSNEATISGTVSYARGRLTGTAFETTGGVLQASDSPTLRPAALTLEAVVSGAAPGPNKSIISKSLNPSAASYALSTGPNGGLVFSVTLEGAGTVLSPAASPSIWDGSFLSVAGTYDGQAVRLYVDGIEVGSGTAASGQVQYGTAHASGKLLFGDFTDSPGTANFAGSIDEIRLYNTALSAEGVKNDTIQSIIFITQPQSQSFTAGSSVTLAVRVQGPAPLGYQWQRNGINLPGATNSSLVLSNAQTSDAGQYAVLVSRGSLRYTDGVSGQAFQVRSGGMIRIDNKPAFEMENFTVQSWVRALAPGTYERPHGNRWRTLRGN
jgi:hypothetical protein